MPYEIIGRPQIDYTPNGGINASYPGLNTSGSFTTIINQFTSSGASVNLPVPKLSFRSTGSTVQMLVLSSNTVSPDLLTISNNLILTVSDFSDDFLSANKVYIEMLIYSRKKRKGPGKQRESGYVVPSPNYPIGTLNYAYPVWGINFWQRSGKHTIYSATTLQSYEQQIDKPNHLQVTGNTQVLDLTNFLNGRFVEEKVAFRNSSNIVENAPCIIPLTGRRSGGPNLPTKRFAYSPKLKGLYFAFRYVLWSADANNGRGQIISGPISPTIKAIMNRHPFSEDFNASITNGKPCATYMYPLGLQRKIKLSWENNLP